MVIFNILVFIFVLGLVIIIHELGHFIMAKRANILCHEFSLGMGPILWSKRIKETLYCIRLIPIGGYVMMAGEEIQDEVVKEGQIVRLVFDDFSNVEKIIIDYENEKYEQFEKVTVYNVDLKGENNEPLQLNDYTVKRDAFYIYKNRELQIAPIERSFDSKTKMQRFLAMFAGPFMNFVLAFFIFILVNLIVGFPNSDNTVVGAIEPDYPAAERLLAGDEIISIDRVNVYNWDDISEALNMNPADRMVEFIVMRDGKEEGPIYITPIVFFYTVGFHSKDGVVNDLVVGEVNVETLAGKAGLLEDDVILTIDGIVMNTWLDVSISFNNNIYGEDIIIEVLRGTETIDIEITPYNHDLVISQGLFVVDSFVGISPIYEFDFFRSFTASGLNVKASASMIFTTIRLLFNNDQVGVGDLAGPVGIYTITSRALSAGFVSFLTWTALLSVNLGVINLLPIPALDGGRLVFLGYEAITSKKPNRKVENTLHYAMYIMLLGLFVYITFNDILRLFNIR